MYYTILCMLMTIMFAGTTLAQVENGSIQSGGATRTYLVHVPSDLPPNPPLVLSMHGLGGTGQQQRSMSGFDAIADREKFIVAYPDGNYEFFGTCCGWDVMDGPTDTDFLGALIDKLVEQYDCDPARVYACGFSMGGMVSYYLACAHGDKLAAIGPCAGYNPCAPSAPLSVCHIHGTEDEMVGYEGAAGILDRWIDYNGCPQAPEVTEPYPESNSSSKAKKEYWGPCENGEEVALFAVEGMTHAWPGGFGSSDIIASEELWEFFKRHPGTTGSGIDRIAGPGMRTTLSAACRGGAIHLTGTAQVQSVTLFTAQGRVVGKWYGSEVVENAIVLPVDRCATGVCVVCVSGPAGQTALRVVVP